MTRRLAPAGLVLAAGLSSFGGASSLAHLLVLLAIPAAGVAVLDAVSGQVEQRSGAVEVVLAVAGLSVVVGAGAADSPLVALPAVLLFTAEPWADSLTVRDAREPVPELP